MPNLAVGAPPTSEHTDTTVRVSLIGCTAPAVVTLTRQLLVGCQSKPFEFHRVRDLRRQQLRTRHLTHKPNCSNEFSPFSPSRRSLRVGAKHAFTRARAPKRDGGSWTTTCEIHPALAWRVGACAGSGGVLVQCDGVQEACMSRGTWWLTTAAAATAAARPARRLHLQACRSILLELELVWRGCALLECSVSFCVSRAGSLVEQHRHRAQLLRRPPQSQSLSIYMGEGAFMRLHTSCKLLSTHVS